jgi:hypothetical protein
MELIWLRKCRYWYWQMIAHDYPIEQSNGRVATNAETSDWHLWTVIIPRRSISGKLVSGQVWRRRHGAKWAYKKFVEYADRDITGSGARNETPIRADKEKPAKVASVMRISNTGTAPRFLRLTRFQPKLIAGLWILVLAALMSTSGISSLCDIYQRVAETNKLV